MTRSYPTSGQVCFWVATEIITTEDPFLRIEVLARFIQVALVRRNLNSFVASCQTDQTRSMPLGVVFTINEQLPRGYGNLRLAQSWMCATAEEYLEGMDLANCVGFSCFMKGAPNEGTGQKVH